MRRRACPRSEEPGAIHEQQLRHGQDRVEVQLWSARVRKGWARGKPKAIEDLGDRRLLGDRGDEPKCSAAPRAFESTCVEHPAKKSRPVHVRTSGRDAPTIGSLGFGPRLSHRSGHAACLVVSPLAARGPVRDGSPPRSRSGWGSASR